MRYWHQREVSNRLRIDRLDRKEAREPHYEQLEPCIGFDWTREDDD